MYGLYNTITKQFVPNHDGSITIYSSRSSAEYLYDKYIRYGIYTVIIADVEIMRLLDDTEIKAYLNNEDCNAQI